MAGATENSAQPPGGGAAFEDVYRSHYLRLVVLARLMTGAMAFAEDIVQDAFVQLHRNWTSIRYPVTYVRIAVLNGCRSHGRRRARERRHHPPEDEPVVFDAGALAVRDALSVLTPRQRAAVVLRYYEDLPEHEIAEALGCRPGTVKSLLSRSLARMSQDLKESEHD